MAYSMFMPKLLTINSSYNMTASLVTDSANSFTVYGDFRESNNLTAFTWSSKDTVSHPYLQYPTKRDYIGVQLSFDMATTGPAKGPLDLDNSIAMACIQTDSTGVLTGQWFVNLAWYTPTTPGTARGSWVANVSLGQNWVAWESDSLAWSHTYEVWEPIGTWDDGTTKYGYVSHTDTGTGTRNTDYIMDYKNGLAEPVAGSSIPYGSTVTITFSYHINGTITLPMDSLKQGTSPYYPDYAVVPSTMDAFQFNVVATYFSPTGGPTGNSDPFTVAYTNWTVTNGYLGEEPAPMPAHPVRVAEGYDDSTNQTPQRLVEGYVALGFNTFVDLYIGASHFYDTKYDFTASKFILDPTKTFNSATSAFITDYTARLATAGFTSIIGSISMELMHSPAAWVQKASDGSLALSGYTPPTQFTSFCNTDAQTWYLSMIGAMVTIWQAAGLVPWVQFGEPWWWYQAPTGGTMSNPAPCFYDAATTAAYLAENGTPMPTYPTCSAVNYSTDTATLNWLAQKNWAFGQLLRDHLRSLDPAAKFGILFFPPSVLGASTPRAMSLVNFPQAEWTRPALDFFEVEDYDWVISGDSQHSLIYRLTLTDLKYSLKQTHYYAGYVATAAALASPIWENINSAILGAFSAGFETVVLWAMTQVRRDGWTAPPIVWTTNAVAESTILFTQ